MSGAPAHRTSCAAGSIVGAASRRCVTPFWRVMRPTKTTAGRAGRYRAARARRPGIGPVLVRVDAVVDHARPRRVDRRDGRRGRRAPGAPRDTARYPAALSSAVRSAKSKARSRRPAARLPRALRLEPVDRRDVRDVVVSFASGRRGSRTRCGVDDVGAGRPPPWQVDREGAQRGQHTGRRPRATSQASRRRRGPRHQAPRGAPAVHDTSAGARARARGTRRGRRHRRRRRADTRA